MMLLASLVGFVALVVSTSEAKIWLDVFSVPRVFLRTADCGGFLKILPVKLLFFINSYVGFANLAGGAISCPRRRFLLPKFFSASGVDEGVPRQFFSVPPFRWFSEAMVVMEFLAAMFWMLQYVCLSRVSSSGLF
ncbi:LOW QUALITY PROTEIN: hypothetical protein HID58_048695, partial [Brassica napus]